MTDYTQQVEDIKASHAAFMASNPPEGDIARVKEALDALMTEAQRIIDECDRLNKELA